MAGAKPKKLSELSTELTNTIIVALIVSKTTPNFFLAKDSSEFRGVITFTIRDSKRHLINCKFWGSKGKVEEYNRKFHINDVIDVFHPQIVSQPFSMLGNNLSEDRQQQHRRFQPLTTTPFLLIVNEGKGFIEKHLGDSQICEQLWTLARVPHKPLNTALNLADVKSNDINYQSHFVDLLVVAGNSRPVKEVRSKRTGEFLKCLEIIIFDRSVASGMVLTIWNFDWIKRAQQFWIPMKTVLYMIDARVAFSQFHKTTVLDLTNRTLIYENPIGKEADELVKFAETVPISELDLPQQGTIGSIPKAESITTIMTIKQIYARADGNLKDDSEQFTAVLFAMISKFDIDGTRLIIRKKCKSCGRQMIGDQVTCDFHQCQMNFSFNFSGAKFDKFFNIDVHLSDHTGTLLEVWLSGEIAEKILGINVLQFEVIDEDGKDRLKWKFLMDNFKVKLLIKKKTAVRKNLSILIVDMEKVTLDEISKNIVVY